MYQGKVSKDIIVIVFFVIKEFKLCKQPKEHTACSYAIIAYQHKHVWAISDKCTVEAVYTINT